MLALPSLVGLTTKNSCSFLPHEPASCCRSFQRFPFMWNIWKAPDTHRHHQTAFSEDAVAAVAPARRQGKAWVEPKAVCTPGAQEGEGGITGLWPLLRQGATALGCSGHRLLVSPESSPERTKAQYLGLKLGSGLC